LDDLSTESDSAESGDDKQLLRHGGMQIIQSLAHRSVPFLRDGYQNLTKWDIVNPPREAPAMSTAPP